MGTQPYGKNSAGIGMAWAEICPWFFNPLISRCLWWIITVFFYGISWFLKTKKVTENEWVVIAHFYLLMAHGILNPGVGNKSYR